MKQQQQELETGADESPASAAGAARAAAGTAESRASSLPEPATAEQGVEPPRPAASAAAASLLGGGGSLLSGGGGSYSTLEGVMTLLVMEYCSLGSLHRAISAGRFFLDRRAQRVNLVRRGGLARGGPCGTGQAAAHVHRTCIARGSGGCK